MVTWIKRHASRWIEFLETHRPLLSTVLATKDNLRLEYNTQLHDTFPSPDAACIVFCILFILHISTYPLEDTMKRVLCAIFDNLIGL